MVTDEVIKYDSYVIYGAQVIAVGAREAIAHLTGMQPECFAVGRPAGKTWFPTANPEEIDGIPVVSIDTIPTDTFIVLGITELIRQEAIPYLDEHGYKNYYPLTQHAGTLRLVGTDEERIYDVFTELLENKEAYEKMSKAVNPYGDGHACERIADILEGKEYREWGG